TGFKSSQMDFQDLIYVTQRSPGAASAQGLEVPTGLQIGSGVRVAGSTKLFQEGSLTKTDNVYDLAIEGEGFFKVTLPSGDIRYTRDGTFRTTSKGELVTADGYFLDPKITIPQNATSVAIGIDGTVSVTTAGTTTPSQLGKVTLARFANPTGLSSEGRNLY